MVNKLTLTFNDKNAEPQKLMVDMEPAAAKLTNTVTWTSSDEKVATVSSDGTVTPVAEGTCTITASVSDTVKTEVKVTVNGETEVLETPSVTTPSKATISKAVSADYNKAKITWKKVSGANGYIVYRATSKSGTYKAVKTITKAATTSYTDTKLTTGKTYYYKVAAYTTTDGKKITGEKSAAKAVKIVPKAVSGLSVKNVKSKKAILTWKKVNGADGYVIYRASKENGTYKRVGTAKGTKYTSFRLTVGKTYYYKVRAYKGNKKVYGDYSAVKKVKIRK
jgi:fibronectin type 3 domain-containing protein